MSGRRNLIRSSHSVGTTGCFACPNCNSVTGDDPVDLDEYLWPDRDNTARAFTYGEGGLVDVADAFDLSVSLLAGAPFRAHRPAA